MKQVYLDNNATTQPADTVVAAMDRAVRELWANPSSVHRPGQAARQQVELARAAVADLIGCRDRDIVFTSGGTESDNLALLGTLAAAKEPKRVLVTSHLEHSAVREPAEWLQSQGTEVVWLETDERGVIRVDALRDLLARRAGEIALVSIMWANNETGIVQPVEAIGAACREHEVRFHTDAVQWIGKMPTDVASLPVDLLTLSAHKFHGPKGIGGLYVRRGVRLVSRAVGGSQELRRRGGTENVPGIVGLGAAATAAKAWLDMAGLDMAGLDMDGRERASALRDRFERELLARVDDTVINGAAAPRLWNTSNVGFRRLEAEAILLLLSERGVCASAGAACASGSLDPSPVLLAAGVAPEYAHGSVRFSVSRDTTEAEIDHALDVIVAVIGKLRGSLSVV